MRRGIRVGAGLGEHGEPEIEAGGGEKRAEHDAAGGDPRLGRGIGSAPGARNGVQPVAGEGAEPVSTRRDLPSGARQHRPRRPHPALHDHPDSQRILIPVAAQTPTEPSRR